MFKTFYKNPVRIPIAQWQYDAALVDLAKTKNDIAYRENAKMGTFRAISKLSTLNSIIAQFEKESNDLIVVD